MDFPIKYVPEGNDFVPIEEWGKDHWSTLAYVETRCVDHKGVLSRNHMRTDARLHRHMLGDAQKQMGFTAEKYPTVLRNGVTREKHDDWSCLEDMVAAGLCETWFARVNDDAFGNTEAKVVLTPVGRQVAGLLRAHKSTGGNFAGFVMRTPELDLLKNINRDLAKIMEVE